MATNSYAQIKPEINEYVSNKMSGELAVDDKYSRLNSNQRCKLFC